ncbi:LOW QUALITY PROTEIN: divergent paired-related homeobox [Cervus canadensis]|uniref:LOW QUALITY PROTEIN: divergent paired-related homeobox n=1 Tax=Cervus canadensis TaxID=1574408 RepID=UPI001CA336A1|nr:LOW QUALITY PROTEIN: divergent paired-related homeobox [Cervus canadensis]
MEAHLDNRMSDPDDTSEVPQQGIEPVAPALEVWRLNHHQGKYRKHSKRKRTMFMEKQLAYLNFLKKKNKIKNPYPTLGLQREMASKMELHPTVLQPHSCFSLAIGHGQYWLHQGERGCTSKVLSGASLESLVPTDPQIPSFQLSIWPALKDLTDHSLGHKMVHFGCYQDPNIYYLYPIVES